MPDDEGWDRLICGLRAGDQEAAREFCELYGEALERVATRRLPDALRRRVGPEDVAQSACRTFLRRVKGGEYLLAGGEGLWPLLCAITLTKVREQVRFHRRQKRGLDREAEPDRDAPAGGNPDVAAAGPTPAEAAEFADQLRHLLDSLDPEAQAVLDLKLQDFTADEIAARLGCSERTVRRVLKRVQAHMARALDPDGPPDHTPDPATG